MAPTNTAPQREENEAAAEYRIERVSSKRVDWTGGFPTAADTACKRGGTLRFGRQVVRRRSQELTIIPEFQELRPSRRCLFRSQRSDELAPGSAYRAAAAF